MNNLIDNIDKLHTTKLGNERIKKNLNISGDVVKYCQEFILNNKTSIILNGKNYYCIMDDIVITVNTSSYTIITAHREKLSNKY